VVECFAAGLGGGERDGELLLRLLLPDEIGEALGAQFQLDHDVVVDLAGGDEAFGFGGFAAGVVAVEFLFVGEVH
jgi:hypothetical protein